MFADVSSACDDPGRIGAGTAGLAILGEQDLQGLAGAPQTTDPCGVESSAPLGRWIGGLGHEFGHDLGLPHPPGCDQGLPTCDSGSLMYLGYLDRPATYFSSTSAPPCRPVRSSATPVRGRPTPPDTVGAAGPADLSGRDLAPTRSA